MKEVRRFDVGKEYQPRRPGGVARTVTSREYEDWQNDFMIVWVDTRGLSDCCYERSFARWAKEMNEARKA